MGGSEVVICSLAVVWGGCCWCRAEGIEVPASHSVVLSRGEEYCEHRVCGNCAEKAMDAVIPEQHSDQTVESVLQVVT